MVKPTARRSRQLRDWGNTHPLTKILTAYFDGYQQSLDEINANYARLNSQPSSIFESLVVDPLRDAQYILQASLVPPLAAACYTPTNLRYKPRR